MHSFLVMEPQLLSDWQGDFLSEQQTTNRKKTNQTKPDLISILFPYTPPHHKHCLQSLFFPVNLAGRVVGEVVGEGDTVLSERPHVLFTYVVYPWSSILRRHGLFVQ